jgi:hypothetical protein
VARATKRKSPSRSNRRDPHRGASLTSTHERFSDGVKKWVSYSDVEIELKKEYWARGVASDSDSGEGKEVQGEDSGGVGEGEGEEAEAAAGEGGAAADEGGLGRSPDKSASRRTAQSPTSPGGDSGKPVRSKEERKKTPWENKEVQLAFLQACKNVNCNPCRRSTDDGRLTKFASRTKRRALRGSEAHHWIRPCAICSVSHGTQGQAIGAARTDDPRAFARFSQWLFVSHLPACWEVHSKFPRLPLRASARGLARAASAR